MHINVWNLNLKKLFGLNVTNKKKLAKISHEEMHRRDLCKVLFKAKF